MDEGARFEVRFEKARGLTGVATDTFEASLGAVPRGEALWTWRDLADAKRAEVHELKREGLSVRKIAEQLRMSKSAGQRALTKCPAVPAPKGRDTGTVYSAPGQRAGHDSGQGKQNAYAAMKNGT
jgi:hypothetical protein